MDYKNKKTVETNLNEILSSMDLFLIRNYIQSHKLMVGLTFREINDLYYLFTPLHSVFDIDALSKEYIKNQMKKIKIIDILIFSIYA